MKESTLFSMTDFSFKRLLDQIMPADKTLPVVRHELKKGKIVRLHTEEFDEWIIASEGKFAVLLEGDSPHNIMETCWNLDGKLSMAFFLPKGKKHGLRAESDLSYIGIKK